MVDELSLSAKSARNVTKYLRSASFGVLVLPRFPQGSSSWNQTLPRRRLSEGRLPVSVDGGNFDLRLLRDLLDGFGADAADLPGDHARVRIGSKRRDDASPLFRRKSFSFFRFSPQAGYSPLWRSYRPFSRSRRRLLWRPCLRSDWLASASTMRARVSGESRFLFSILTAASRMSAFLAIALTVDGAMPPISLATALAFGFILSASAIFSRASGEVLSGCSAGADSKLAAMTPTVDRLTPPTCLATAAQFGSLCSALRIACVSPGESCRE